MTTSILANRHRYILSVKFLNYKGIVLSAYLRDVDRITGGSHENMVITD